MSVWERRKEILDAKGPVYKLKFLRTTPLLSVRPIATIAMAVEYE